MHSTLRLTLLVMLICVLAACSKPVNDSGKATGNSSGGASAAGANPAAPSAKPASALSTSTAHESVPATGAPEASATEHGQVKKMDLSKIKLMETDVQFRSDDVKYRMLIPEGAEVRSTEDAIGVQYGGIRRLAIVFGPLDLNRTAKEQIVEHKSVIESQTMNTLICKRKVDIKKGFLDTPILVETHDFFMNRSLGYRDFKIESQDDYPHGAESVFDSEHVKLLQKMADSFALAEELPHDPAAILEHFRVEFERNEKSEIIGAVIPRQSITESSFQLIGNLPTIEKLNARFAEVKGDGWSTLAKLSNLAELDVTGPAEADEATAKAIGQLLELKTLRIGNANFPIAGFKHLEPLQRLESLHAESNAISDKTIDQIPLLPHLQRLSFDANPEKEGDQFTGASLGRFAKLTELKFLDLAGERITDEGLAGVGQLRFLTGLDLSFCGEFSGSGLVHLVELSNLESLNLGSSKITEAAVDALCGLKTLKSLKMLNIQETIISDEGFAKIKAALPQCEITFK